MLPQVLRVGKRPEPMRRNRVGEVVIRRAWRRKTERVGVETVRGIREQQELSNSPEDQAIA